LFGQTNAQSNDIVTLVKVWVFRHQTNQEKYTLKNIHLKSKGGSLSQMICACFVYTKLGPIIFVKGMINAEVYIRMLDENLIPFIDILGMEGIVAREREI
jgi:hypothetical protein